MSTLAVGRAVPIAILGVMSLLLLLATVMPWPWFYVISSIGLAAGTGVLVALHKGLPQRKRIVAHAVGSAIAAVGVSLAIVVWAPVPPDAQALLAVGVMWLLLIALAALRETRP